jgi:hypothetical protein
MKIKERGSAMGCSVGEEGEDGPAESEEERERGMRPSRGSHHINVNIFDLTFGFQATDADN